MTSAIFSAKKIGTVARLSLEKAEASVKKFGGSRDESFRALASLAVFMDAAQREDEHATVTLDFDHFRLLQYSWPTE